MRHLPLILLFFFLIPIAGASQHPSFEAAVEKVDSSGFYRIPLRPVHTKCLRDDLGDLRLFGKEEGETPFLIRKVEKRDRSTVFREIEPIELEQKGGYTGIIFERPADSSVKKLVLYLEEPSRSTRLRLEGSEDPDGEWEEVRAEERIRSSIRDTASSEYWVNRFLNSGHRYYRIRMGAPAPPAPELVTMGYREHPEGPDPFYELPRPSLHQKDLEEKSYIRVKFDSLRQVDELELRLEGPRFFRRSVTVGVPKQKGLESPVPYTPVGGSVLSDTLERIEGLDARKASELLLIIENGDDPPLQVEALRLFQERRYLVAHLEKGEEYRLELGGDREARPRYDLHQFQEHIPEELPVRKASPPERISKSRSGKEGRSNLWIWLSILVSILVLGAFSYRLVKEGKD